MRVSNSLLFWERGRGWEKVGRGIFFGSIKRFLRGLREVVHLGSFVKAKYSNNILVSYVAPPSPSLRPHLCNDILLDPIEYWKSVTWWAA
jgi:hypothetical protein